MKLIVAFAIAAAVVLPTRLRAQVADPSAAGPLPVSNVEYQFNGVSVFGVGYPVDVWSVVWYPTGLPGGPYPLVVFLHGNHGICRNPDQSDDCSASPPTCESGQVKTQNHRGYDYIAQRLAGYGYIVVSINANAINCRPDGILERGRLVQEHFRRWRAWNAPAGAIPFGTQFSGKVDLANVGLMGHSRGGEGVRAAYQFNRTDPNPVGIRGVMEIGPVDFHATDADNVPWSVVLPACDGDVSDLEGILPFDRAQFIAETNKSPKAFQLVWGAIHNFFNSVWAPETSDCYHQTILTRPQQEQVGRVYVMGFMRTFLGNENFGDLFTRDLDPPASVPTRVDNGYTESPSDILVVDNLQNASAPAVNDAGGANTFANMSAVLCAGGDCDGDWLDDPSENVAAVTWPTVVGPVPSWTADLAPGAAPRDVSGFGYFNLRVSEQSDARNPSGTGFQNFTLHLVDGTGAVSAGVVASSWKDIHPPVGPYFSASIPESLRIPLSAFTGVDRTAIRSVRIDFDQEADGALFISNLHFDTIPTAGRGMADFVCDRTHRATRAFLPILGVHLVDDFEDGSFDVRAPSRLCNPAGSGARPISDGEAHLEAYPIRPSSGSTGTVPHRGVSVVDELGSQTLDLMKSDLLLVPSSRDATSAPPLLNPLAHAVSHFKCYTVKRTKDAPKFPRGLLLTRTDELTSPPKLFEVIRPRHLCRSVSANDSVVKNAATQLTCYQVKAAVGQPGFHPGITVFTNNEFGGDLLGPVRDDDLRPVAEGPVGARRAIALTEVPRPQSKPERLDAPLPPPDDRRVVPTTPARAAAIAMGETA